MGMMLDNGDIKKYYILTNCAKDYDQYVSIALERKAFFFYNGPFI